MIFNFIVIHYSWSLSWFGSLYYFFFDPIVNLFKHFLFLIRFSVNWITSLSLGQSPQTRALSNITLLWNTLTCYLTKLSIVKYIRSMSTFTNALFENTSMTFISTKSSLVAKFRDGGVATYPRRCINLLISPSLSLKYCFFSFKITSLWHTVWCLKLIFFGNIKL